MTDQPVDFTGVPTGIRTPVTAVKGVMTDSNSSPFRCCSSALPNLRSTCRNAPLYAFWLTLALPCLVLGPVDFSQGRHLRISAARKRRCSGVR
jgi:hypothetical protein